MAFFGLTHLGYQNPIGDQMIVNPRGESSGASDDGVDMEAGRAPSPRGPLDLLRGHQPPPWITEGPRGSHQRLREIVKRAQTATGESDGTGSGGPGQTWRTEGSGVLMDLISVAPAAPPQLYRTPLTLNQQYGWTASRGRDPWMQTQRFPRRNSEMTKFVDDISKTHRGFCLL
ncbi:uncharacterized protein [Antennarius striatus]|uniref:uncharacterized protein isoform X1 n=1 Tax=Antennarius striatus TaxID=241820 RepID=UPI0035B16774